MSTSDTPRDFAELGRALLAWVAIAFAARVTHSPRLVEPHRPKPARAAPRPASPSPAGSPPRSDGPADGKPAKDVKEAVSKAGGWTAILKQLMDRFVNDRVMSVAAGVTFYGLLALFPALGALVSLYALVADPTTIQQQLNSLGSILPGGATEIIGDQIKRIASKGGGTLGFGFIAGLAISLWSANSGVKAMFDALNIVYNEKEKRGFIRLNLVSLLFTLGMIVFMIVALSGIVVLPVVLNFVGMASAGKWLTSLARWPILLGAVVLALAALYRWGPCRPDAHWRWLTPGSAIAAVLWVVASAGFSYYAANFGSYNETYGTLGAAIGMMTWMWISINVVLLGGEINAQIESQSKPAGA